MSTHEYEAEFTSGPEFLATLFPTSRPLITIPCSRCGQGITSEVYGSERNGDTYTMTIDPEPSWQHYRNNHQSDDQEVD